MSEMREIPGFSGYHCDRAGNIYTTRKGRDFHKMAAVTDRHGYLFLHISPTPGAKRKNVFVHQLVARTWVCEPAAGQQVNHRNACRTDNRAENLEWISARDNVIDGWQRTRPQRSGENHPMARYSDDVVRLVRQLRSDGVKRKAIATQVGLPIVSVKNILAYRSRPHV